MNVTIEKPSPEHLKYLSDNLREVDRVEAMAAVPGTPLEILEDSVRASQVCHTVLVDDAPALVFGATPLWGPQWGLWMLGTDQIKRYRKTFVRLSRDAIGGLFHETGADGFLNYTHIDNHVHHRWLESLGAVLGPPTAYGWRGELFRPFVLSKQEFRYV